MNLSKIRKAFGNGGGVTTRQPDRAEDVDALAERQTPPEVRGRGGGVRASVPRWAGEDEAVMAADIVRECWRHRPRESVTIPTEFGDQLVKFVRAVPWITAMSHNVKDLSRNVKTEAVSLLHSRCPSGVKRLRRLAPPVVGCTAQFLWRRGARCLTCRVTSWLRQLYRTAVFCRSCRSHRAVSWAARCRSRRTTRGKFSDYTIIRRTSSSCSSTTPRGPGLPSTFGGEVTTATLDKICG